jgi:hypothetical protein
MPDAMYGVSNKVCRPCFLACSCCENARGKGVIRKTAVSEIASEHSFGQGGTGESRRVGIKLGSSDRSIDQAEMMIVMAALAGKATKRKQKNIHATDSQCNHLDTTRSIVNGTE